MRIGFTGTRVGMTDEQTEQLRYVLALLRHADKAVGSTPIFHHGGAIGADTQAHEAARTAGCFVFLHPALGAPPFKDDVDGIKEAFPPLDRNRHIVASCDVLIAAPETDREQQRSGTWATVRYARAARKPVVMLSRGDLPKMSRATTGASKRKFSRRHP